MAKTIIIEQQAPGVAAHMGVLPASGDNQRILNTVLMDEIGVAAGGAPNTYVFPIGPYDFEIDCPAYECGGTRAMLWDFTNNLPLILGQSQTAGFTTGPASAAVNNNCRVKGRYVVTAAIDIGVMQRLSLVSANGFGAPCNDGREEDYTTLIATRAV